MITTALTLLVMLFFLEILFTVGCGTLLLLRRADAPPTGRRMRLLWTAVLLLSLIPLRLYAPHTSVTVYENAPDDVVRIQITEPDTGEAISDTSVVMGNTAVPSPAPRPITIRLPSASADAARILLSIFVSVWIIGTGISALSTISEQLRAASLLRRHSVPCTDGRILSVYRQCARQMGMNPPPLRMFEGGMILSPCCSGIFRPAVYISQAQTKMSDESLVLILTHELSHIRAHDPQLSLLASAACAVHWINPLCDSVIRAIVEDCELSCDENVLRVCGDSSRVPYIHAILDIASGITAYAAETGSFSVVRERRAEFIKRRYDSMKNKKSRRLTTALAAAMACILLVGNVLAMSSCAFPTAASDSPAVNLQNPVLAAALAEYFGLASADELTEYHMSQITSLEISTSKIDGSSLVSADEAGSVRFIPVRIRVNGGVVPTAAGNFDATRSGTDIYGIGGVTSSMYADGFVFETLPIMLDKAAAEKMADAIRSAENGDWNCNKFLAFYCLKDADADALYALAYDQLVRQFCDTFSRESALDDTGTLLDINGDGSIDVKDVELLGSKRTYAEAEALVAALPADVRDSYIASFTEQVKNEILTLYPFAEARPMYILDPECKPREVTALLAIMQSAGLLENRVLSAAEFDLADAALMGNLTSLTISEDLTAVNMPG